jgi:hypothetical protein
MVITSTQQEVDEQWGLYDGYRKDMADALKYRYMSGRAMPHMEVIPPGLDFSSLKVLHPFLAACCNDQCSPAKGTCVCLPHCH